MHTHTHRHTQTHTHTHTDTQPDTHTDTPTYRHTHTHTHSDTPSTHTNTKLLNTATIAPSQHNAVLLVSYVRISQIAVENGWGGRVLTFFLLFFDFLCCGGVRLKL